MGLGREYSVSGIQPQVPHQFKKRWAGGQDSTVSVELTEALVGFRGTQSQPKASETLLSPTINQKPTIQFGKSNAWLRSRLDFTVSWEDWILLAIFLFFFSSWLWRNCQNISMSRGQLLFLPVLCLIFLSLNPSLRTRSFDLGRPEQGRPPLPRHRLGKSQASLAVDSTPVNSVMDSGGCDPNQATLTQVLDFCGSYWEKKSFLLPRRWSWSSEDVGLDLTGAGSQPAWEGRRRAERGGCGPLNPAASTRLSQALGASSAWARRPRHSGACHPRLLPLADCAGTPERHSLAALSANALGIYRCDRR